MAVALALEIGSILVLLMSTSSNYRQLWPHLWQCTTVYRVNIVSKIPITSNMAQTKNKKQKLKVRSI